MNRKFKFVYYLLVAVFTIMFSYQIYRLINLIVDKPAHEVNSIASDPDE